MFNYDLKINAAIMKLHLIFKKHILKKRVFIKGYFM